MKSAAILMGILPGLSINLSAKKYESGSPDNKIVVTCARVPVSTRWLCSWCMRVLMPKWEKRSDYYSTKKSVIRRISLPSFVIPCTITEYFPPISEV